MGVLIDLIRPFQPGTGPMAVPVAGHITVAGSEDSAKTFQAVAFPDGVLEGAIRRLESSGASRNTREAVDGLRAMGYELILAKTTVAGKPSENYLRIMDPMYAVHGIGYLTPSLFSFSRGQDRERLAGLPGATLLTSVVNFSHVKSAQPGLNAAKLLKG